MKIAVLGARGFVGSSLVKYLSKTDTVVPVTRDTLDLLDAQQVRDFLHAQKFDVIINAAAVMHEKHTLSDTRNNLGIFMNFHCQRALFGTFINLASGAEFDRTRNIENAIEADIFRVLPADSYGFGQNMKSRISFETPNFYTIRIFNCFGPGEPKTRIFPRFLESQGNLFHVLDDRYFDYFSIEDLCRVVSHCCNNDWNVKDVNAVYDEKFKISEVLKTFCDLNNLEDNFQITSTSENNYTGSSVALKSLDIPLSGLNTALMKYLEK